MSASALWQSIIRGESSPARLLHAAGLILFSLMWIVSARASNLLLNPGFEELDGGVPRHWHVYLMPMDGACAAADSEVAQEGAASVKIVVPRPYPVDPANNWSQNVEHRLAGKDVLLAGHIKTEQATDAAIWLQAFRKRPWALLQQSSTSATMPVGGTRDWTPVEMRVKVPEETDFVVVRCVLQGQGTAWFDGLRLEEASGATAAPVATPPQPAVPPSSTAPGVNPAPSATDTLEALRDANRALIETNNALREKLDALEKELRRLREQLESRPAMPAVPQFPGQPNSEQPVRVPAPPLIPRTDAKKEVP